MALRICLVLLVLVFLLTCAVYVRGGLPYEVHRASGAISALGSDARGLYWLETAGGGGGPQGPGEGKGGGQGQAKGGGQSAGPAPGGNAALWVLDGGRGPARQLLAQPGLVAAAGAGEAIVVLQRTESTGSVLLVPRAGGEPVAVAQGLSHPVGLAVCEGEAYWTETTPRLIHHARHIPATQARIALRAVPLSGQGSVRTVACLGGGTAEFVGEIIGGTNGRFYLVATVGGDFGPGWSHVRSVATTGGVVETLARERGPQTGRLVGDVLYWTGPSEDAGNPGMARTLRCAKLPGVESQTLTDWLPATGRLCELGGRVYCGSMSGLWMAPERRALPQVVTTQPVAHEQAAGFEGAIYEAHRSGQSEALMGQPRTVGARLKAGMRIP